MDIEKHIGGLIMAGFEGKDLPASTIELISKYKIGGVILYKRNIESKNQLRALVGRIKEVAGNNNFLVAIDHEGGRVFRLPPPFTQIEPMDKLGEAYRRDQSIGHAYELGRLMAKELNSVGINLNFAPVLDINTNPYNPIIGNRAFDVDPQIVSLLACELIRGMTDGGILCCGKHFPGHGDTCVDSHLGLPRLNHTLDRLKNFELLPYEAAIKQGVPSIMTAHIIFGVIDPRHPATLSKKIIGGVLREMLGFEGVVFTDDVLMKAISDHFTVAGASVMSIQAGCDMIIISKDSGEQMRTIEVLKIALKKGELSEEMVLSSLKRIDTMRGFLSTDG